MPPPEPAHSLVSVIIPTYNRARTVALAIDSALGQTHSAVEILVVDDGSTDGTRELIARKYGGNSRVRYLHKENGGVSSARNLGLREARGEFIAFLDSDDWWYPEKLSLQLECLAAAPEAGMVWTDMAAELDTGEILFPRYLKEMYKTYRWFPRPEDLFDRSFRISRGQKDYPCYSGDIYSMIALGNLVHTSTVLLRRERAMKTGVFREDYRCGEDYVFHLRTCREGPVCFLDAVTVKYRIGHPDALTRSSNYVALAQAFVETLETTLREDRGRIQVPAPLLRECKAEAYSWLGREHLAAGDARSARPFLLRSLREKPGQPRTALFFTATFLPAPARAWWINLRRSFRK